MPKHQPARTRRPRSRTPGLVARATACVALLLMLLDVVERVARIAAG